MKNQQYLVLVVFVESRGYDWCSWIDNCCGRFYWMIANLLFYSLFASTRVECTLC